MISLQSCYLTALLCNTCSSARAFFWGNRVLEDVKIFPSLVHISLTLCRRVPPSVLSILHLLCMSRPACAFPQVSSHMLSHCLVCTVAVVLTRLAVVNLLRPELLSIYLLLSVSQLLANGDYGLCLKCGFISFWFLK